MKKVIYGTIVLVVVLALAWVSFVSQESISGLHEATPTTIYEKSTNTTSHEGNPPELVYFGIEGEKLHANKKDSELCYRLLANDETDIARAWVEYSNGNENTFSWWIDEFEPTGEDGVFESSGCIQLGYGKSPGLYAVSSLYISDSFNNDAYYEGSPFCSRGDVGCIPDGDSRVVIVEQIVILPTITPSPATESPVLLPLIGK